jgi:glycosyltransferase involved in cell wall biosynthesis
MPKVLRIINRFNLGGITYNVSYLTRYMPADYETLLAGGPEEKGEGNSLFIPHSLGLEPVLLSEMRRSINPLSDFLAYRRIVKLIRTFRPDIVHTHASKAGALGRLAAIRCRVPVIVHTFHGHVFHGYFGFLTTGTFKAIERWLARRTTAIVAISDRQKAELSGKHKICSPEKISVIPLGFDLGRFTEGVELKRRAFRDKYKIDDNEIAIGIIGRLAPIKNHFLFIDAVHHLQKRLSRPFKALVIGDGETSDALKAYAASYRLTGANAPLIFTGWIREADVALAGLDIVALTSRNEGTPVSLIEAQAVGRFIVSTDVGGIADILHPSCGYLSKPGDDEAFCSNLLRAADKFDMLKEGARAAMQNVKERFSYKRLCSEMDALYRELL